MTVAPAMRGRTSMPADSLTRHLRTTLAAADLAGRRRVRRIVAPLTAAEPAQVLVDGRRATAFCSNDYLGLCGHPRVTGAFTDAARRYGVGAGASHLISGHGPEHAALEEALADFVGRESAVVFSTGYMANLGIASALVGRGDVVVEDRLNHASLIDAGLASGARFARYAHADAVAAERLLTRYPARHRLLWTDGVFSMDGDMAPLRDLARVAGATDAWLIIDDAHGFGVLGEGGCGSVAAAGLGSDEVPVLMATLGKALGVAGAFVAGSRDLIDVIVQRSRTYIYTTAMPPAVARAAREALQVIRDEPWRRSRLDALITRFRAGAKHMGLTTLPSRTPIQPLTLGSEQRAVAASAFLLDAGFLVPAIRPPTVPVGQSRLRITLSAAHTEQDVDDLLGALADWQARNRDPAS